MTAVRHRVPVIGLAPVIGLVGGIGSGKSSLAKALRKNHRIEIVEGDPAGHEVLKEQAVKEQIHQRFGDGVFDTQGEIDRRRMSELVFGTTPAAVAARASLEAIVHPRITERLTREIAAARSRPDVEFVLLDAALLLEAGWRTLCDRVIYVGAREDQRQERVARGRGWTIEQLRAREESQFPLERKRKEADDVIDNTLDADHALSQLETILSRILPSRKP